MLISQHRECLARGGLPIHEYSAISALVGKLADDGVAALIIYLLVGVGRSKCMIVYKLVPITPLNSRAECWFLLMFMGLE